MVNKHIQCVLICLTNRRTHAGWRKHCTLSINRKRGYFFNLLIACSFSSNNYCRPIWSLCFDLCKAHWNVCCKVYALPCLPQLSQYLMRERRSCARTAWRLYDVLGIPPWGVSPIRWLTPCPNCKWHNRVFAAKYITVFFRHILTECNVTQCCLTRCCAAFGLNFCRTVCVDVYRSCYVAQLVWIGNFSR